MFIRFSSLPGAFAPETFLRRFVFCFALAICCTGSAAAQNRPVAPQDDTQSWNEQVLIVPLDDNVNLLVTGQLRIGDRLRDFTDEFAGASLSFAAGKYLSLTPGYTYVASQQPVTRRRRYEHRLTFSATIRLPPFKRITISDRNQVERRRFNSLPDTTRYRNRLQAERPFDIKGFDMRVFLWDEIFYDSGARAWSRNRFAIGGSRDLNKHATLDLYYQRQSDGRSRPGDIHVIGTVLRSTLR